ncbi:hypothetical protein BGX34_004249 [Mortierella sp. NVP85]|nr:hypothetical protein BGX34_004249 [Mortierella sp. NVP85]
MNWLGYFYTCDIPGDAEVVKFNHTIDSSKFTRLYYLLEKGVYGDVAVFQSQNPRENNILVSGSIQTSKPEILKHVSTYLDIDSVPGRAQAGISVEMTPRELDKILKRECVRTKVNIVLPRNIKKFGDIMIDSGYRGDVEVDIGQLRLDALAVLIEKGDADVKASVDGRIEIQSRTGKVKAKVQAEKSVVVTAERDVELELTTESLDLHARAVSIRSSAKTVLTQPFYGHFELSSSFWKPELRGSKRYLKVTHSDNHTMEGYFSSSWREPWYLPRIEVKGTGARLEVAN